jgi:hypothetical protein
MNSLIERYYEIADIIKKTDQSIPKANQPVYKERETRAIAQACHILQEHLSTSEAIDPKQTLMDLVLMQLMFDLDFKFEDASCQEKIVEEINQNLLSVLKNEYSNEDSKLDTKKFTTLALKILRVKSLSELKIIIKLNPEIKPYIELHLLDYSPISQELFERVM